MNKQKTFHIYVLTFPNGKRYIGHTSLDKMRERWQNGNGYKGNKPMSADIKTYGWNNIIKEVFDVSSLADAKYGERYLIHYYHTYDPLYGYNKVKNVIPNFNRNEYCIDYREKNRTYYREYNRLYHQANKERLNKYHQDRWRKLHPISSPS